MDDNVLLKLENVLPRIYGLEFSFPINWTINKNEQWCVVGPNGSGKTFLADLVAGHYAVKSGSIDYAFWTPEKREKTHKSYPSELIKKVSFESAYLLADYKNMYYQQRFHSFENETTPTVEDLIKSIPSSDDYLDWITDKLRLKPLYSKRLIMLSSGELRRLLIVFSLAQRPELIIFDNPFIGLDVQMRKQLDDFFIELAKFQQMMFLVPAINEIPSVVTNVMKADHFEYENAGSPADFIAKHKDWLEPEKVEVIQELPKAVSENPRSYQYVMKMTDINISYGDHPVFKNLNWTIEKGQKWALLGQNGAGKSTLLSLLAADNPKAYAQDIVIFDRQRGSGESIWDIKKPIGYISSEMHLYFHEDQPCLKIVSSGLFDTIGLFRNCSEEQAQLSLDWMRLMGIEYLKDKSYLKISGGEQRMVLLARTLVKNPDLLILDEPLHGLDMCHKRLARAVIEKFCMQEGKSMIYVTHRREEIPSCVDHVFELKKEA